MQAHQRDRPTPTFVQTCYTAAMVLHNHLALQGVTNLETLSFWSYSDIFEEGGVDSQPWHNGCAYIFLLNSHNLRRPPPPPTLILSFSFFSPTQTAS